MIWYTDEEYAAMRIENEVAIGSVHQMLFKLRSSSVKDFKGASL